MAVGPVPGQWVEQLCPAPRSRVQRSLSDREYQEAASEIGESAVDWALVTGCDVADIVSRHVPQLGQGSLPNVLPASMQKSVLSVLIGIRRGSAVGASMGEAELEIMGVCARTGIELTSVLTAIRRGQGVMVERLMQQCRALVDIGEQYPQYQLISELSFAHVDALATQFAQLYEDERRRWLNDPLAARVALINQILTGNDAALAGCSTTLRFEIKYRHHLAVCAWSDRGSSITASDLEVAALDYLRHNGAAQTLVLHDTNSSLTVWGNTRGALTELLTDLERPDGVHLAVGTPGSGVGRADEISPRHGACPHRRSEPGIANSTETPAASPTTASSIARTASYSENGQALQPLRVIHQ